MVAEFRSRGRKPKKPKPRQTQGQQWRAVHSPDAVKLWPAHDRDAIILRLKRERKHLRRAVPSEPWFDAKWNDGEQFPPGGDVTLMNRCRHCDRYTPPQCLTARGVCDECRYNAMSHYELEQLPSSPGIIDMARLKASRMRGETKPS